MVSKYLLYIYIYIYIYNRDNSTENRANIKRQSNNDISIKKRVTTINYDLPIIIMPMLSTILKIVNGIKKVFIPSGIKHV